MRDRPKVTVRFDEEIDTCQQCPKSTSSRTIGAGYAFDYFCTLTEEDGKPVEVMHYIEYPSEYAPVPDWCPALLKEVDSEESTSEVD